MNTSGMTGRMRDTSKWIIRWNKTSFPFWSLTTWKPPLSEEVYKHPPTGPLALTTSRGTLLSFIQSMSLVGILGSIIWYETLHSIWKHLCLVFCSIYTLKTKLSEAGAKEEKCVSSGSSIIVSHTCIPDETASDRPQMGLIAKQCNHQIANVNFDLSKTEIILQNPSKPNQVEYRMSSAWFSKSRQVPDKKGGSKSSAEQFFFLLHPPHPVCANRMSVPSLYQVMW